MTKHIFIEGTEFSGKTTLADNLELAIRKQGFTVMRVREPGGTMAGEALRDLLKETHQIYTVDPEFRFNNMEKLLLLFTSRSVLCRAVRTWEADYVIWDRSYVTSLVHQGLINGADLDFIADLLDQTDTIPPDLVVFLNPPIEVIEARAKERGVETDDLGKHAMANLSDYRDAYRYAIDNMMDDGAVISEFVPSIETQPDDITQKVLSTLAELDD